MIGEESAVDPQGNEVINAFEAALTAFAEELTLLHIASGSPSYATIASASVRSRLTKSGLTEMLTGKRLPSQEALLEFVRVVTTPSGLDKPTAAKFRADPDMVQEWRDRWQHVKVLQRQAQRAKKRLRVTDKQVHDDTSYEPESLHIAEQTRTSEDTSGDDTCTTTQQEDSGDVTAEEYVRIVESTFDTSIPKEARITACMAGSLVSLVTICIVALAWADNTELFVKIMYSASVLMVPWAAALADIINRTQVLDARRQIVLLYLLAAGVMAGPTISYLEGHLAEGPLPVQIVIYAVMLVTTTMPLALLSGAVDGLFPELEDEVKDLIRKDRARVQQLNADKQKAIQRARSWRRYYELQGEPLVSRPQPVPREDASS
ncbi:hypothetical protein [Streptomyces pactum]|uniref:Uncharacterized protein n=1 Tax=Streptomyces pactum TaxID=68249 RepID=A0A1S6J1G1_9ACTN|nr:hypothetical protein [Streptomyces pactum]AQS65593.1 hypothetical protein B1H29_00240 [Streptomyces pactum]AQS71660.1 hypothetical protein B1H29_36820 [Streptomyces pactum]